MAAFTPSTILFLLLAFLAPSHSVYAGDGGLIQPGDQLLDGEDYIEKQTEVFFQATEKKYVFFATEAKLASINKKKNIKELDKLVANLQEATDVIVSGVFTAKEKAAFEGAREALVSKVMAAFGVAPQNIAIGCSPEMIVVVFSSDDKGEAEDYKKKGWGVRERDPGESPLGEGLATYAGIYTYYQGSGFSNQPLED